MKCQISIQSKMPRKILRTIHERLSDQHCCNQHCCKELFKVIPEIFIYSFIIRPRNKLQNNLFILLLKSPNTDINCIFNIAGTGTYYNLYHYIAAFTYLNTKYLIEVLGVIFKRPDFTNEHYTYETDDHITNQIKYNNLEVFKFIVKNDKNMTYRTADGNCISYLACFRERYEFVDYLITNKFDKLDTEKFVTRYKDNNNKVKSAHNTITWLIYDGEIKLLNKLLDNIKSLKPISNHITTFSYIGFIVKYNNITTNYKKDLILKFLEKNVDVNYIDRHMINDLFYAIWFGDMEIFDIILNKTTKLNLIPTFKEVEGMSLISYALKRNVKFAEKMVKRQHKLSNNELTDDLIDLLHSKNTITKELLLSIAVAYNHLKFAQTLLRQSFRYEVNYGNGHDVGMYLCSTDYILLLKLYTKHYPIVVKRDKWWGNTCLHVACMKSNYLAAMIVLNYDDCAINWTNNTHKTPLILAIEAGCIEIVHLLIHKGADVNLNSPLLAAIILKNNKIIKLLLDNNAKIDLHHLRFVYDNNNIINERYDYFTYSLLLNNCINDSEVIRYKFIDRLNDVDLKTWQLMVAKGVY